MNGGEFMDNKNMISLIYTALEVYEAICQPVCSELQLPQTAFDILMFLANNPEYFTAKDISKIRGIKPNMVSFHVDKLVNKGFLVREPIPRDRRQVKLVCTEKADPIIARGHQAQKIFLDAILDGLNEEDIQLLHKYKQVFANNIEKMNVKIQKGFIAI